MSVITGDLKGRTDGPAFSMLERVQSDIPIVLMSRTPHFKFNKELLNLDKFILAEFSEMGWDWQFTDSHEWGKNTDKFPQFDDEQYRRFDEFIASKPPLLTFTRELLRKDVTDNHLPIDYPAWIEPPQVESKEQFDRRFLRGFFFWGRSSESRVQLHGDIWKAASKRGYSVCDNIYFFEEFLKHEDGHKWVSLWSPHYCRIPIEKILSINGMAKVSIAMFGAGIKTFRACESSFNSVMAMPEDKMAWAYPWINDVNCIRFGNYPLETIEQYLENQRLYEIYCAGVENCRKYYLPNYIQHIENQIRERI